MVLLYTFGKRPSRLFIGCLFCNSQLHQHISRDLITTSSYCSILKISLYLLTALNNCKLPEQQIKNITNSKSQMSNKRIRTFLSELYLNSKSNKKRVTFLVRSKIADPGVVNFEHQPDRLAENLARPSVYIQVLRGRCSGHTFFITTYNWLSSTYDFLALDYFLYHYTLWKDNAS